MGQEIDRKPEIALIEDYIKNSNRIGINPAITCQPALRERRFTSFEYFKNKKSVVSEESQ